MYKAVLCQVFRKDASLEDCRFNELMLFLCGYWWKKRCVGVKECCVERQLWAGGIASIIREDETIFDKGKSKVKCTLIDQNAKLANYYYSTSGIG